MTCGDVSTCFAIDAAGNFIVPLSAMSYNAYKTVIDIDTLGTFNCSKAVFDKWFKVGSAIILRVFCICPCHAVHFIKIHVQPFLASY